MLSALSGPALALLISLPGIPGFHFPGFSVKHRTAAPRDTIPPPWKPASMLALDDQFVLGFLPKRVQSLLGPGSPALNVSGSENIRLAGESNWTNQQIGPLGQKRSLFPSLDMQQDLNIQLEGQLSDRIRVNLLQNSLNQ